MKKFVKRKNNKQRFLLKAHRYIGLFSFIVLCWLSVSGLLLNHTEELQLDQQFSHSPALLSLYNIPTPEIQSSFSQDNHWIYLLDQQAYFNQQALAGEPVEKLIGAIQVDEIIALATPYSLKLYLPTGEYIDSLSVKNTIEQVGQIANSIAIQTKAETQTACLQLNEDLTAFNSCPVNSTAQWLSPSPIPDELKSNFLENFQGKGISLERVLLDTHSGRIFNMPGVYFMDFMALLIIFIAISGVSLWLIRKIKKFQKKRAVP